MTERAREAGRNGETGLRLTSADRGMASPLAQSAPRSETSFECSVPTQSKKLAAPGRWLDLWQQRSHRDRHSGRRQIDVPGLRDARRDLAALIARVMDDHLLDRVDDQVVADAGN